MGKNLSVVDKTNIQRPTHVTAGEMSRGADAYFTEPLTPLALSSGHRRPSPAELFVPDSHMSWATPKSSGEVETVIGHVGALYRSLETRYQRLRVAYARLLEQREPFDERIRTMHDMQIITDTSGGIEQVNRSALIIAPAHRLVGSPLRDWLEVSQQGRLQALQNVALKGSDGSGEEAEVRLLRSTSDPFGIIVSLQVLPVREGRVAKTLHWVLRDVNPEINSAFKLQKPLVAFERVSECVFMTDASGLILTMNAAFTRITGYTAAEAIGRNPRFLGSGLQDAVFYKEFWQELQSSGQCQGHIFNEKKMTMCIRSGPMSGHRVMRMGTFSATPRLFTTFRALLRRNCRVRSTPCHNRWACSSRQPQTAGTSPNSLN
jgi:PAS domain-containing protein